MMSSAYCAGTADAGSLLPEASEISHLVNQINQAYAAAGNVPDAAQQAVIDGLKRSIDEAVEEGAGNAAKMEAAEALIKGFIVIIDGMIYDKKKALYDLAVDENEEDIRNYNKDQAALNDKVTYGLLAKIDRLYEALSAADALTYAAEADFERRYEELYPGYDTSISDFSANFKDLMTERQNYAYGSLSAGNSETSEIKDNLAGLLKRLNVSSLSAEGYLQVMQARNQIYAFAGQEILNLRVDMTRQIEARAMISAERQRKRTVRMAAFERAIGWKSQSAGRQY
jgi:P-type conjugative transfer protein TrbJ